MSKRNLTTTFMQNCLNLFYGSDDRDKQESLNWLFQRAETQLRARAEQMFRKYHCSLRNLQDADDVLQEASLRMFRFIEGKRPSSTEHFFSVAELAIRHSLITLYRKHVGTKDKPLKRPQTHPVSQMDEPEQFDAQETIHENDDIEMWVAIHECVPKLPAKQQKVFRLHWYEGLSANEIAQQIGDCSLKTVYNRLNTAREMLAQFVEHYMKD